MAPPRLRDGFGFCASLCVIGSRSESADINDARPGEKENPRTRSCQLLCRTCLPVCVRCGVYPTNTCGRVTRLNERKIVLQRSAFGGEALFWPRGTTSNETYLYYSPYFICFEARSRAGARARKKGARQLSVQFWQRAETVDQDRTWSTKSVPYFGGDVR